MTPIHDWSQVDAGLFHHFHQRWIAAISDALNAGGLPPDYYALAEQRTAGREPDVLALHLPVGHADRGSGHGGTAIAKAPPRTACETTWNVCPRPMQNAVMAARR